jgi:hypothetical protein
VRPPAPAPAQQQAAPAVATASTQQLEIPPAMRQDPAPAQAPVPRQDPPVVVRQDPPVVVRHDPPPAAARPAPALAEPAPAAIEPSPAELQPAAAHPAFSDVAALIQSLPVEEESRRSAPPRAQAVVPASRPAATPARSTAANRPAPAPARTAARAPAPPAHPSRHWVQLANGERSAFAYQLGRLRQAAPDLLRSRTAWWARNGSSERLLVGPFATAAEARAFVTQLSRQQVSAFPWTSEAGEEVARLPAR